jgi:hypothetical protein
MPDWQKHVSRKLAAHRSDGENWEEVCAELAAHLEESYQTCRAAGLGERQAVETVLGQVTDWQDLRRRIAIARQGGPLMEKRWHRLWVPGLLSFALSTIMLTALESRVVEPRVAFLGGPYFSWLLSLACAGALSTYLSFRAGASESIRLLANLLPALALAAAFLLMFPISLFLERVIGWPVDFRIVASVFLKSPVDSLLLPAAALLLGGLPVQFLLPRGTTLRERAVRSETRNA